MHGDFSERLGAEQEEEPKVLELFSWEDTEGIRGEKGVRYDGAVRYAQAKDREGIKAVELDKWRYRTEKGYRDYTGQEPSMSEFDENINNPDKVVFIVLTIDGEVVGHVDFGEDHLSEIPDSKTVELYTVTTIEKYQRNGFMTRLLRQAEKEAQRVFGAEKIILSTQEENPEAIAFYSSPKVGYQQLSGHFESQGTWNGKNPYWSVRFIKHLKKLES
jgi:ribosomal protein S18 acetylase RimI-like enzyme